MLNFQLSEKETLFGKRNNLSLESTVKIKVVIINHRLPVAKSDAIWSLFHSKKSPLSAFELPKCIGRYVKYTAITELIKIRPVKHPNLHRWIEAL